MSSDLVAARSQQTISEFSHWRLRGILSHLAAIWGLIAVLLWLGFSTLAFASTAPPNLKIIEADSLAIKIIDDGDELDGIIVPELKPDIYTYYPTTKPKTVSFVTDKARIDIRINPGEIHEFAVRLKSGKLAYQRFAPTVVTYQGQGRSGVDTIPFRLSADHLIHIKGTLNGSEMLDLHFDTGANTGVLSRGGIEKGAKIRTNNDNMLKIEGITIDNARFIVIDSSTEGNASSSTSVSDGLVGYDAFLGKIVEIDYGSKVLRIRDKLPPIPAGYRKEKIIWRGAGMFVPVNIFGNGYHHKTQALFDTGANFALGLTKEEALSLNQGASLRKLGESKTYGANSESSRADIVSLPNISILGHTLRDVRTIIATETINGIGLDINIAGNDLLHRFDVILDLKAGDVYIRPNEHLNDPYGKPRNTFSVFWMMSLSFALMALSVFALRRWSKNRQHVRDSAS